MESTSTGDLVTVAGDGPKLDGIVFDTPSTSKVVVAVVDRGRRGAAAVGPYARVHAPHHGQVAPPA